MSFATIGARTAARLSALRKLLRRALRRRPDQPPSDPDELAELVAWLGELFKRHVDANSRPTDHELARLRAIPPERLVAACPYLAFSKLAVLRTWLLPEQRAAVTAWLDAPPDPRPPAG